MPNKDTSGQESDGVECVWDGCERSFSSENGMKSHHAQIHGESIAGVEVECAHCGDTTSVKPVHAKIRENNFCDGECMGGWQSENQTGENNPRWVEKVEVECSWCGEIKSIAPSLVNESGRHFCNPEDGVHSECKKRWQSENIRGEKHPNWNGGLTEVECEYCGDTKSIPQSDAKVPERHFCNPDDGSGHSDCRKKWRSENISGEDHHQWVEKVEVDCSWCGEIKLIRPSLVNESGRHFCNPDSGIRSECQLKWLSENRSGKNNPNWKRVEVACDWCGETKLMKPHRANRTDHHFCDPDDGGLHSDCWRKWWSEYIRGEDHPLWNGGEVPYGSGWTDKKKELVRERDGRECQHCGRSEEEHLEIRGTKHAVHHIQKARTFDDPDERNHQDILVTLCSIAPDGGEKACHKVWEDMSPLRPEIVRD